MRDKKTPVVTWCCRIEGFTVQVKSNISSERRETHAAFLWSVQMVSRLCSNLLQKKNYCVSDGLCLLLLHPLFSVPPSLSVLTDINHCWQSISSLSKSFKWPPKGQNISNTSERGWSAPIQTVCCLSRRSSDSDPVLHSLLLGLCLRDTETYQDQKLGQ